MVKGITKRATEMFIEITPDEAMAIDSLCKNEAISQDVFLQIGEIILSGAPMKVAISEQDLWRIREAIPYSHMIGRAPVGLTLKKKVYECLLNMDMERELGLPVSNVEETRFDKKDLVQGKPPERDRSKGDES